MSDLIDRQAAIDAIKREQAYYAPEDGAEIFYEYNHAIKALKNLPSAQPERKKGKWTNDASCPFCGFQPWYERDIHTLSFCPNCGARMEGKDE